jgi:hypothetical protein
MVKSRNEIQQSSKMCLDTWRQDWLQQISIQPYNFGAEYPQIYACEIRTEPRAFAQDIRYREYQWHP